MAFGAFEEEDKDKTVLTGLQNAAGDQTSPSGPEGSAASQGALGAPASAGAKPAFADRGMVVGDDIRDTTTSARYIDMWDSPDTKPEDQDATVEVLETTLGAQGSGVTAKASETISNMMKQGDMPGLSLALDWGWRPEDEAQTGSTAFAGKKNLGSEFTVQEGEQGALGADIVPGEEKKKPKWDRKRMGGFLMEFGLRMLASDRDDAGAAFGDAALGTISARDERKKTAAAEELAKQERERKVRREDEADLHKREKAARDKKAAARAETEEARKAERYKKEGYVRVDLPDGGVAFGKMNEETGHVEDPQGKELKGVDATKVTPATRETNRREQNRMRTYVDKLLTDSLKDRRTVREDPELKAIDDEKNSQKKKALKKAWREKKKAELEGQEFAVPDPLEML